MLEQYAYPRHAVADFYDGFVLAQVPDHTASSERGGKDVLHLTVPTHTRNLLWGLGTKKWFSDNPRL